MSAGHRSSRAAARSDDPTIAVRVRLFAGPREIVGAREIALVLPAGATIDAARAALEARYPPLARYRDVATLARNREPAAPGVRLADGDELALLPPVSGGGIVDAPFDLDTVVARLAKSGAGAVVTFLGFVRPPATRLEFDAYREMADAELARVRDAAVAKFALTDAVILHRVGTLATGEAIVLVAVAAPHRAQAFEAAQWIMDELKTVVPIWKREVTPTGEHWVNDPTT